jgi:hypothetical protein
MVVGFNVAAILTTTFADDKDCRKNDDNNCNETKKTQKSSPKAECEGTQTSKIIIRTVLLDLPTYSVIVTVRAL